MGVVTVTDTSSIEGAATIMDGTGDAVIIMDGIAAAATTSTGTTAVIVIIDRVFAESAFRHPLPGRCADTAMRPGRALKARPVQRAPIQGSASSESSSAQPHLDGDPDQVRMVLGAEFLLEQGCGVGNGLV
jgi:hypothetical protein